MNDKELMLALLAGKKMKTKNGDDYIFINEEGNIENNKYKFLKKYFFPANDYEEYIANTRCVDCIFCVDLKISDAGDLINHCKPDGKNSYYKSLLEWECEEYIPKTNKAKIQYKS